jgi:acetoin utilization deacetylase AcuC-like enzyme
MKYNHKIFWNDKYTGAEYAFDTTRKSAEIVEAIGTQNISDPQEQVAEAEKQIGLALTNEYFDALQYGTPLFLSESNGFKWDYGIYQMALNSTAGVMSAVQHALDNNTVAGSLSSGLHHANHERGMGFCTVNGLGVVANWLQNLHITILDFDAHCGGGTVSMIRHHGMQDRVEEYDISTNKFDDYEEDSTHNIRIATNDAQYLKTVDQTLDGIKPDTELVLYNAGTDPHPRITHDALAERDRTVFQWAKDNNKPIAYVLAGGYTMSQTMEELVQSHINTLDAADSTIQL